MANRVVIIPSNDFEEQVAFDPLRFMDLTGMKLKLNTDGELCNFSFKLPDLPSGYAWEILRKHNTYEYYLMAVNQGKGSNPELEEL